MKLGRTALTYNPSTWEVGGEESGAQGYPWLHRELGISLGHKRTLSLKREREGGTRDARAQFVALFPGWCVAALVTIDSVFFFFPIPSAVCYLVRNH